MGLEKFLGFNFQTAWNNSQKVLLNLLGLQKIGRATVCGLLGMSSGSCQLQICSPGIVLGLVSFWPGPKLSQGKWNGASSDLSPVSHSFTNINRMDLLFSVQRDEVSVHMGCCEITGFFCCVTQQRGKTLGISGSQGKAWSR